MPHLKLSWQEPGTTERKLGGVWWGRDSWLLALLQNPPLAWGAVPVLQAPVPGMWQGELSPLGWDLAQGCSGRKDARSQK